MLSSLRVVYKERHRAWEPTQVKLIAVRGPDLVELEFTTNVAHDFDAGFGINETLTASKTTRVIVHMAGVVAPTDRKSAIRARYRLAAKLAASEGLLVHTFRSASDGKWLAVIYESDASMPSYNELMVKEGLLLEAPVNTGT